MLPAFDWNGGRLQLESLAGIVGIRTWRERGDRELRLSLREGK